MLIIWSMKFQGGTNYGSTAQSFSNEHKQTDGDGNKCPSEINREVIFRI